MLNAASEADACPSFTVITMFENVPTLEVEGVPVRAPVEVLKAAQAGLFCTLKVSVRPAGPLAVGVKAYPCSSFTCVAGVPLMVGGTGSTWTPNAGRAADA